MAVSKIAGERGQVFGVDPPLATQRNGRKFAGGHEALDRATGYAELLGDLVVLQEKGHGRTFSRQRSDVNVCRVLSCPVGQSAVKGGDLLGHAVSIRPAPPEMGVECPLEVTPARGVQYEYERYHRSVGHSSIGTAAALSVRIFDHH